MYAQQAPVEETEVGSKTTSLPEKDFNLMFSAVEAQWILTVLDDTLNKLSLSSYLTPDILKDRIMDAGIDHETVVALKEHFEIEKSYTDILQEHMLEIQENNGEEVEMGKDEKQLFENSSQALEDSTRTVVRLLKMNPVLARKLRDICEKRTTSALDFINIFARLRKLIHDKLRMTAEEEKAMREQLDRLQEEDAEDKGRIRELNEGLAIEKEEHKQALSGKDRKIARLREQIESLTIQTQQNRDDFENQMQKEADLAQEVFERSKADLEEQLGVITKKLGADGQSNYAEEMKEHRKKFSDAVKVEKLIEKYDQDMGEKHDNLTALKKMYEEESEELQVLSEYFSEVDAELRRQAEEIADLTARRDEELVRLRTKHQAAVLIQKLFRGFHAKNLAGGKKKKESKKDKKK